jgi:uncharacterized membrane protein
MVQTYDWVGEGGAISDMTPLVEGQPPPIVGQSGDLGGMVLAGVLVAVLGLAVVVAWRSQLLTSLLDGASEPDGGTATESAPGTAEPVDPETTAAGTESEGATSTAEPERATKSDPEIVIDILEANEGRMKQARIVDETGWSKSKVSMVLSEMDDADEISKLRVGRENIISLSGNEPEAAGSPFEDDGV